MVYPLQELDHLGYWVRVHTGAGHLGGLEVGSARLQRVEVVNRILIAPCGHCLQENALSLTLISRFQGMSIHAVTRTVAWDNDSVKFRVFY